MPFNTRKQKHVSRRNVLQRLATIGAAGPLVSACGRNAAIDDTDPFHGWQVGIAYWSLRQFPVAAQLAIIRGLGLDHYECTHALGGSNRTAPMDPADLRTLMTDFGFTPHISYENFDEDGDRSRRLFEGAATLGLRTISTNSGSPAIYDTLESLAREYDIQVGLHNHGPRDERHGKRDQVVAILAGRDARLGVCLDVAWSLMSDEDPVAAVHTFGSRVYGIHLRDHAGPTMESECTIGTGRLDLAELLRELRAAEYGGLLSIETVRNADDPIADLQAHVASIREIIQQL